ncbi:MAG: helix-turn-helix domain-containing protein [Faecalibacterium sp.]
MVNFLLGDYVRQRRLDLGLTQEDVCCGICSPVTLSRLENNHQIPGRARINAILQRLGMPDDRYYSLMSRHEQELEALKQQILTCHRASQSGSSPQLEKGFGMIARLEQLASPEDRLTRQFILRAKALLGRLDGRYSPPQLREMLFQAIRLTVPRFELGEIERFLYTSDEIRIINQIAVAYSSENNDAAAADIYEQLLRYARSHFQETITSLDLLPMILYNHARALGLCGRYEESKALALEGRETCTRYGCCSLLPGCVSIAAECSHFLGQDAESASLYRQSYYFYKALGDVPAQERIRREAKEYLGLTLN